MRQSLAILLLCLSSLRVFAQQPPTAFDATVVTACRIDASWNVDAPSEGELSRLLIATNETDYYLVSEQAALDGVNSFSITSLPAEIGGVWVPGQAYFLRVYDFLSPDSSTTSEIIRTNMSAPAAPSGLGTTVISDTQINLSWTDNSSTESLFSIEMSTPNNSSFSEVATVGAGVTTYNKTGLTAGTTYYFRVRPRDACGFYGGYSNEDSDTTTGGGGGYTPKVNGSTVSKVNGTTPTKVNGI